MTLEEDMAILRAALDASPSSGPWKVWRGMTRPSIESGIGHLCTLTARRGNPFTGAQPRTREQALVDADYIVACEPERIRRLLEKIEGEF